jgi:membrane protein required for colicin V production
MNYLDLIIGLPVILLGISGFRRGLIKELASLAALVLGIYFAVFFSDLVAEWLRQTFDMDHRWVFIVAFLLIFIIVVMLVSLIGNLLNKIASLAALGIINRTAGLLFGIMKGVVIMSVVILFVNMIDSKSQFLKKELKDGSLLYAPVEKIAPLILQNLENIDFDDPSWKDFKKSRKESQNNFADV